jgi:formylglycine-generating enzyme required for sulfatase activity
MSRVPVVFISSTEEDLREYRIAARDAALQAGFFPSMMEYFTASGERAPLEACLNKVREADVVIAIVAHRFGWIPPDQPTDTPKSVTWLECEHAVALEMPVVPLLVDPSAQWPQERREAFRMIKAIEEATPELLADVQRAVARLGDFKAWLDGLALRALFRTPDDLGRQVAHALHDWRGRNPNLGRAEPPATDHREILATYRRELVKASRFLPLRGIDIESGDPTAGAARMELAKVYVTLDTTTEVSVHEAPPAQARAWWRRFVDLPEITEAEPPTLAEPRGAGDRDATRPLTALEAIVRQPNLVILGGPGSGKSTLLNHLTFCLAQEELDPTSGWIDQLEGWPPGEGGLIPIVVVLRDFARTLQGREGVDVNRADLLWQFIQSRLEAQNLRSAAVPLERALDTGHALVLLDGLDEIPTSDLRTRVRVAVETFCRRYERSRHIVTCRTLSYQDASVRLADFPTFELAPFGPPHIDAFIAAWYAELLRLGQIDEHASATYRDRLQEATRRPDLARLAPNPLLLTVMALVHTHKGRLPDARAQLYEEVVDILLWRWEARRGEDAVGLKTLLREVGRAESDLKRVLWQVAFDSHRDGGSRGQDTLSDIAESTLVRALATLHSGDSRLSRDWAWRVVEMMKMRAGLLLERVPGTFTFPHRTFQEYLAGSHLSVQENFIALAVGLARETTMWRPALLLAVGRLIHVSGSVERPLALAAELAPSTLDPATASEADARLMWLAAEVLDEVGPARSGSATGRDLATRVPRLVAALLARGIMTPVERAAMATTLDRIGDPRFRADAWHLPDDDLLGFIEVPAGAFRMGSDPERDKDALEDEQPQHEVTMPTFYIAKWPVTVAQFRAFVEDREGNDGFELVDTSWTRSPDNHAVVSVSWDEALRYCAWLTAKLRCWPETPAPLARVLSAEQRGSAWRVTLPSEAEWEKAARGTDVRRYPWGDDPNPNRANYAQTGLGRASSVGCFRLGASPSGVEDLSGNVWEWTRSLLRPYPYDPGDGREGKGAKMRVLRGGAFYRPAEIVRAAYRYFKGPRVRDPYTGFRVVVSRFSSDL